MRRTLTVGMLVSLMLMLATAQAGAISIGFIPSSQTVNVGDPFSVGLQISGLGAGTAPSLGTFDINVAFNPDILGFSNVVFGDPVLGDQLDVLGLGSLTAVTPNVGVVNLFELSFDTIDDLNNLQASSFTLATLTFDPLAMGVSPLWLTINALGDAGGNPLAAEIGSGSVTVTAVPEPATILLLSSGLAGVGIATWKRRRQG